MNLDIKINIIYVFLKWVIDNFLIVRYIDKLVGY